MDCTVGYTHVRVFTIQILDTVNMRSMVPGGCLCMTKVLGDKPSRWWPSGKSLEPRDLLPLWSQVRALWLLI